MAALRDIETAGQRLMGGTPPQGSRTPKGRLLRVATEMCGRIAMRGLQAVRGTRLLALGDSCGLVGELGKGVEAMERLGRLNPSLDVDIRCASGADLASAAATAAAMPRNFADVCIVFTAHAPREMTLPAGDYAASVTSDLKTIGRIARRVFLVSTGDDGATPCRQATASGSACPETATAFEVLDRVCGQLGMEHICLASQQGSITDAKVLSDNFSVDGFVPARDRHEMWTACMLQRPALAQLVFH